MRDLQILLTPSSALEPVDNPLVSVHKFGLHCLRLFKRSGVEFMHGTKSATAYDWIRRYSPASSSHTFNQASVRKLGVRIVPGARAKLVDMPFGL